VIGALEVAQQSSPATDQQQKATLARVILPVALEMLGQIPDPLGQHRCLNLHRAAVVLADAVLFDQFILTL